MATQEMDSHKSITYLCPRWTIRSNGRLRMGFLSDLASHHRYLDLFPFFNPPISQCQSTGFGEYGHHLQSEDQETNCFKIMSYGARTASLKPPFIEGFNLNADVGLNVVNDSFVRILPVRTRCSERQVYG